MLKLSHPPQLLSQLFKQAVFSQLSRIKFGQIHLIDDKTHCFGCADSGEVVTIKVHNARFYRKMVLNGSLGAAQSFMNGDWSCDNLTGLFQILLKSRSAHQFNKGSASFSAFVQNRYNSLNLSTPRKAKKNILAHYDLSNDFFKLFLDRQMVYSSALFNSKSCNLEQAQIHKLKVICDKLKLKPTDHLLEIGAGWGALSIYAAKNYGCKVTTTTISDAQHQYVAEFIKTLNLEQQVTLLKKDYRALSGTYDKLVSIEMIESIGHHYFERFFKICNQRLKPGGLFLLQSITINDEQYDRYRHQMDFIKKYIFPGGCLPSAKLIKTQLLPKTHMQLLEQQAMASDYARTLKDWSIRFNAHKNTVLSMNFDQYFVNMFNFYFAYCEAGFLEKHIDVIQFTIKKSA